jgi:hypothetical protein
MGAAILALGLLALLVGLGLLALGTASVETYDDFWDQDEVQ